MSCEVSCIWNGSAALGEGPLWHPKEKKLYWVDIVKCQVHQFDPTNLQFQEWKMPGRIACLAPRKQGGFIAGIEDEICFIDLHSGKVDVQKKIPDGLRLNDGKCDRQGRFWVGTISPDAPKGHLYRYDPDGSLTMMQAGIYISNGLTWSLDNRYFYYTDSMAHTIFRYDYDEQNGMIHNCKNFIVVKQENGVPDGLTIDKHGYLWSALWNGFKVVRYTPNGDIDRIVDMPVQRPTNCMFGGRYLDTLYITSCSRDVNENESLPAPSGALFSINIGISGIPESYFLG